MARLEEFLGDRPISKPGQEAELLALLIENSEEKHYYIEAPDPMTAIRIRMKEMQLKQKDIMGIVGSKVILSAVLI